MVHQKIKNLILILMFLVCIYLSNKVWLQLPDFLMADNGNESTIDMNIRPDIDIWKVVYPQKHIIKYKDKFTIIYSDDQYSIWEKSLEIISKAIDSFDIDKCYIANEELEPAQYVKFDFATKIPIEIFIEEMKIKSNIAQSMNNIKSITIDLEKNDVIYLFDGNKTTQITDDKINTKDISKIIADMDFAQYPQYNFEHTIAEEVLNIPIQMEETALNPVFVQSELDVFDDEAINKIAKDYFKNNYDYVRKVEQVSRNLLYMYKNEKVLKITSEGMLDFFDAVIDFENSSDVYNSLITALNFTDDFLGFPKDCYLSSVNSIHYEGNYGYSYTFSYKMLDRPMFFSKIRNNIALQIDVVGKKVVSYKRFIRNIDETQSYLMKDTEIMSALQVIEKNIQVTEEPQSEEQTQDQKDDIENKKIKKEMIKDISNIYLGYFDLARVSREQALRIVWVVEIQEKTYIYNAITGALIEDW